MIDQMNRIEHAARLATAHSGAERSSEMQSGSGLAIRLSLMAASIAIAGLFLTNFL